MKPDCEKMKSYGSSLPSGSKNADSPVYVVHQLEGIPEIVSTAPCQWH